MFQWHKSCSYDDEQKKRFHLAARSRLRKLATELRLPPGTYDIRSNKGGIAVSGEITLHHDRAYVQVSQFALTSGHGILIRTAEGRRDYTGGPNHFVALALLDDIPALAAASTWPKRSPDAERPDDRLFIPFARPGVPAKGRRALFGQEAVMPIHESHQQPDIHASPGEPIDRQEQLISLLRALGIAEIEYSLSGGGDSGETTLERVTYRDGRTIHELPNIPIGISATGQVETIEHLLDRIASDLPEGDWVNNEGGYGSVFIRPLEEDEDLRFECDMTFREEGDYGDDDEGFVDEDEFEEEDEPDEDPAVPAVFSREAVR